ncbi:hypothetical protein Y032_0019g3875 [Ancylostoma ceylanicum]|uniref:Uncharacterized protein n=1 Tax=Ancylostoma ceylanicum TaxID=53326 RepID=A0A016V3F3_9BILA|nr:hypothetical protein Y032_0019g3875 [Ancylostoma ceylanicum]
MKSIVEIASDPRVEKLVMALKSKIPQDIEEERRGRSILISGLPESGPDTLLLKRKDELETNVAMVLETLKFDYWPAEMYRMGKYSDNRPRLLKLVILPKSHWF